MYYYLNIADLLVIQSQNDSDHSAGLALLGQ